jgi:DNA-binding NarL/FixJ family response regulator
MGNAEKTAVLLDRHPLWLEALERLLDQVGVKVVGKTTSPGEALELVEETRPTVLVTEYDSLEKSEEGLGALRRLSAHDSDVHAVVLGTYDDAAHIDAAFAAGASVYCVKTAEPDDLAAAIVAISRAGSELRRTTADWFATNARHLGIDGSLETVARSYRGSGLS